MSEHEMPDPDEGASIVRLAVEHKPRPAEGNYLQPVPYTHCRHFRGPFEVDVDAGMCKCLQCGGSVTPIFVLEQLMKQESGWMQQRRAYQAEMLRLQLRQKTKCERCGAMTRISGR